MHTKIHHKIRGLGNLWGVKAVMLVFVFSAGVYSGRYLFPTNIVNAQSTNTSMGTITIQASPEMKAYEDVKKILDEKYIKAGNVKEDTKAYGSIKGLVESYGDPYTVFFPPTQAKEFKSVVSGSFSGVGMEVGIKDGVLTVISPLKSSPAEKAGMKPDDKILKINGTSTEGMATDVAVSLIRGEKGTSVTLTIFRKGEEKTRDVVIVRDTIDVPVVDTKVVDNAFMISIYSFSETSAQKFQVALQEFAKSKKKNLIIDLRNNPGGYLEAAVLMSSFFFPADKVIVSEDFTRTGQKNVHKSKGFGGIGDDVKIVILVNKGSASASEIFAGAFQDYGRAKIVGEQSFGKGSVQEFIELPNGTSLKVTVARWLTPLGNSISEHGVTPDIIVKATEKKKTDKFDNQVMYAVKVLNDWKTYANFKALEHTEKNTDQTVSVKAATTSSVYNKIK